MALTYLALGVEHILLGIDHLLFVLALLLITRGMKRLVLTITAFTVAHSITLALATLGFVHVPAPPVEAVIALSIVFVAAEILRTRGGDGKSDCARAVDRRVRIRAAAWLRLRRRAGGDRPARGQIPLALFFFNVGVEAGQLAFVGVVLAIMALMAPRSRARCRAARSWCRPTPSAAWRCSG